MIVIIHGNDDTEEACELWQLSSPGRELDSAYKRFRRAQR
jgi:hypothetical protein